MGRHTRTQKQRGFTIIEVTLVMAITGVMIVSLLVGMNTSINTQRYRDAVQTFRNDVQSLYDQTNSVRNERASNLGCNTNAQTTTGGTATNRGQSSCQMLGKMMTIDGDKITTYSVVGYEKTKPTDTSTDFSIFTNDYNYGSVPAMVESSTMEWGTQIAWAKTGVDARTPQTPRAVSILVLRAPQTGQVYTFTRNEVAAAPSTSVITKFFEEGETIGRAQRVVCVDSAGLFTGANMGISMTARAAGASAVESRTNESMKGIAEC